MNLLSQTSLLFCSFLATKAIPAAIHFTSILLGNALPSHFPSLIQFFRRVAAARSPNNCNKSTLSVTQLTKVLKTVTLNLKYSAWCSQPFLAFSFSLDSKFISYPASVLIYLFTDPWPTRLKFHLSPSFEQSITSFSLLSLWKCLHQRIITWCIYLFHFQSWSVQLDWVPKSCEYILKIVVSQIQCLYLIGIQ